MRTFTTFVMSFAILGAALTAANAKPPVNKPCETGQKHNCLPPSPK